MRLKFKLLILLLLITPSLSGCAGFGKGIAQGLLEDAEKKDKRACKIWSEGFSGINSSIHARVDGQNGRTKVLMIHGVGQHIPGYSTILLEKLTKELDLKVMELPYKELTLTDPKDPTKNLGNLRMNRLLSKDRSRELLFYELTWSSISEIEKEVLAYDDSGLHSFRRAKFNDVLKKFSNDAISDPMIYLGEKQEDIQKSVSQSYCWMISRGWNDFPSKAHEPCNLLNPNIFMNAEKDDYIFISHSLGSRITIDALQRLAKVVNNKEFQKEHPNLEKLHHTIQNKNITIYMLSNQLPLLQLGRSLPDILNRQQDFCSPEGTNYDERFANQTHIVAFSDPNDLLSYTIPAGFKEKYLDSRMCTKVSNISLNIANVVDVFGLSEVANPMEAHLGYDHDDRVVTLLAHGIKNDNMAPIIKDRCEWVELTE
jgi:hypothetical protein